MKTLTKIKIINWVEKILNFDRTFHGIPTVEEKRKIHEIRVNSAVILWNEKRIACELIESDFIKTEKVEGPGQEPEFVSSLFVIYPI